MKPLMKIPRDRRPEIWRQGVLQIMVTRACDKSCFGCTQGSNLAGKTVLMKPDQFEEACRSLEGYFGVVGVFGGNPALSSYFADYCRIMRATVPFVQRGLWCNHPRGKGVFARITFNPAHSNLNVHMDHHAHREFCRDWPESAPYLKGLFEDSRHAPPFVALQDVVPDEAERLRLIASCDVNRLWSAMICVVRGRLRGYFCEVAAAQAMLHESDPDWPDLGVEVKPGWWKQGPEAFAAQVDYHCHRCGVPLRGHGSLAVGGHSEQVSETHRGVYRPKVPGRSVELVTTRAQLGDPLARATDYIENGAMV